MAAATGIGMRRSESPVLINPGTKPYRGLKSEFETTVVVGAEMIGNPESPVLINSGTKPYRSLTIELE